MDFDEFMRGLTVIVVGIIGLFVLIWLVAVIVNMALWTAAGCLWFYQVILMPFVVYLSPAFLALSISIGVFWGSYVAARNYFVSLMENVIPQGKLRKVVRYYVISILLCFLVSICSISALYAGNLIYKPSVEFTTRVCAYYATIRFPAFEIVFPFWEKY